MLASLAAVGTAQVDWPTFHGQNTRTGVNANPVGANPGQPTLRWYFPLQATRGRSVIEDNWGNGGPNPNYSTTGAWTTPTPFEESPDWFGNNGTSGSNPYQWSFVVPSSPGPNSTIAGATATATWVLPVGANGLVQGQYYSLSAWWPSSGTLQGVNLVPNADFAVYRIEYDDVGGVYKQFIDVVPHIGGGNWTRLGNNLTSVNRIFRAGPNGIRITIFNTVPRDGTGALLGSTNNRIVNADAVLAVPSPGSIYGSPAVANVGPNATDNLVVVARNESRPDPTDPLASREITLGVIYGLNAAGPNITQERWNWSPNLITNFNQVYDNSNGTAFNADAAWSPPTTTAPGFFGQNYVTANVTLVGPPGSGRAVWTPTLPQDGFYDVYAWFPRSGNGELHARGARYVVDENGTQTDVYVNQDTQGGNWVRLGTRPWFHDSLNGGLKVEVWNYSNNPGDAGRVVCADAVMFVGQYTGSIFSTPTIATVNIRQNGGGVVPTPVAFVAAEDGRIYCLDARGNGVGSTTVYWAYPSIPDPSINNWTDPNDVIDGPPGMRIPWPGSFGVSSMLVQRIGGKDLLFIAAGNGRVYAIDTIGRGDYDATQNKPGTTMREWTWPRAKWDQSTMTLTVDPPRPAFVASVAYDPANNQIFAAGTEGRIFALDAAGNNDQTTNNNWAFPLLTDPPVGAISSTPTIGGGRVIFTSFDGRVYARDLNGNTGVGANWQFPPVNQAALIPFSFTSPAYVTIAELGGGVATDMVYVINENSNAYALQGTDGALVWTATGEVPSGAFSSPAFTRISPPGTALTDVPIITFGTQTGAFIGLYALPGNGPGRTNSAGGKLAWGYQSTGETVFASPAASYNTDLVRGYMFHAGTDGYLYAFSEGGLITIEPGFPPPGQIIETPDDPSTNDFVNLKIKLVSQADYSQLRNNAGNPATMADIYGATTPVLEFGERLYVVAYDFVWDPNNIPTIRFRLNGPGGLSLQYDRVAQPDPSNPNLGMATMAIPIMYTGQNYVTPGDLLTLDVLVVRSGRIINPPAAARNITVANPLAFTTVSQYAGAPPANKSVGWSSDPNFTFGGLMENHINGSNDKAVMTSAGQLGHGQSKRSTWFVADRSRMLDLTGTGLTGIRMVRSDGRWQGGAGAVIKPLPYVPLWEVMPVSIPNLSPDYPDIDRSNLSFIADPNGNLTGDPTSVPVRLLPPSNYDPNNPLARVLEGVRFDFELDVPRFQPANLTLFTDTANTNLDGGYRARALVYIDANNNGRPDGQAETLTDLPPGGRREPYRSLNAGGSVLVDETMRVTEQTVDLGSLPHSLGYTPGAPWTNNGFIPDLSNANPYRNFFKPFTVVNEGNVNMLDLRVANRIGNQPGPNYYPVAFNSDSLDPLAWLNGIPNIITNLNPPYAPNNGVLDASGNPRVTLHKARPGDRAGTVLSVPDVPYGFTPPANSLPTIGVAIPLGTPVGEYNQLINVIEDNFLIGGVNDRALLLNSNSQPLESFTDPTMRVKFLVRETRLTGGQTGGTVTHIDPNLGVQTNFTFTGTQPSGFRDPAGNLHLVWSSNRPTSLNQPAGPQSQDQWSLFFSDLQGVQPGGAPGQAGTSPFRDLMGWTGAANNRFWTVPQGPAPTDPVNTLFAGTPGNIVGGPQYTTPSFPVNPFTSIGGVNPFETVFWNGKVLKDDSGDGRADFEDNRIFYAQYTLAGALGPTQWLAYDNRIEKKRIRPLNFPANPQRMAVFWFGEVNGVSRMFQNVRTLYSNAGGDQSANWSRNIVIDPGAGFALSQDPQPMMRSNGIDLVFTGMLKDRPQPEIFFARYSADSFGRLRDLRDLPDRNRETLVRESGSSTYRARGVNWNTRRAIEIWIRRPNQVPFRIDIANTRSTDDNTGIISFDSEIGGKIYADPHVGTVRLTNAPGSDVQLELRYTPRVMRVSELGNTGGHTNPSSFLDMRPQWDGRYYFTQGGTAFDGRGREVTRYWHVYERGATGAGQTKRPYMKTQRLQVRLPFPVELNNNGNIVSLVVTGHSGVYQVDPANGRVFFEQGDEGRFVTITYMYRDGNGISQSIQVRDYVQWLTEMTERPVPIEQAYDEGTIFVVPDPFVWQQNDERTGLVWIFYTSTRAGTRDVFYQTLAPNFRRLQFP